MLINLVFTQCALLSSILDKRKDLVKKILKRPFKGEEKNTVSIEERINNILDYRNEVWHENRYKIIINIIDHLSKKEEDLEKIELDSLDSVTNSETDTKEYIKQKEFNIYDEDYYDNGMMLTSDDIEEALMADTEESNTHDNDGTIRVKERSEKKMNSNTIVPVKSFSVDLCDFLELQPEKTSQPDNKSITKKETTIGSISEDIRYMNKNGELDVNRKKDILNFALWLEGKLSRYYQDDVPTKTINEIVYSEKRSVKSAFYSNLALRDFKEIVESFVFVKKSNLKYLENRKFEKLVSDKVFMRFLGDLEYLYSKVDDYISVFNK